MGSTAARCASKAAMLFRQMMQASSSSAFPTAKAVPDKPGYVFSPFDSSRYVDVSGYTSGTKVKDPWTDKIFVVP